MTRFTLTREAEDSLARGDLLYVEEVADMDLYLTRMQVIVVRRVGRELRQNEYQYRTAALRFPRLANKFYAMRAMQWGITGDE